MIKKYLLLLILFLFASGNSFLTGQVLKPESKRKNLIAVTDSILSGQVALNKIPGAVILIKKGNKIIYRKAYGFAGKFDFNMQQLPRAEKMTCRHLFDIASLTKVVGTTTSIMLLTDKGLINPDDSVFRYISAFNTPEKRNITIRHLLTHTAGLYEWYPLYYTSSDINETYNLIEGLPLKFPVGEQRRYSDLGFVVLGKIIEVVSGESLDQFMQDNIFNPLRMKNTAFNPLSKGMNKKISSTSHGNPYEKRMVYDSTLGFRVPEIDPQSWNNWRTYTLRGEVNDGNAWYACGGISGAAGLFSTADDLQKLVDIIMNKGKSRNGRFISEKTIELFIKEDKFRNGLGWMMDRDNSFMKNGPAGTFGHTGFTGTSIAVIPEYNTSVILLINRQNTGLLNSGEYFNVNPVRLQIFNAVVKYLR